MTKKKILSKLSNKEKMTQYANQCFIAASDFNSIEIAVKIEGRMTAKIKPNSSERIFINFKNDTST